MERGERGGRHDHDGEWVHVKAPRDVPAKHHERRAQKAATRTRHSCERRERAERHPDEGRAHRERAEEQQPLVLAKGRCMSHGVNAGAELRTAEPTFSL
jgi:hypothetical protein